MSFEFEFDTLPENSVILLEEENGCIKSIYAQTMAANYAKRGKRIHYYTSFGEKDIESQMHVYQLDYTHNMSIIGNLNGQTPYANNPGCELCIIDPFSLIFVEKDTAELKATLKQIIEESRKGRTYLLVSDTGIMPPQHENLVRAMVDGIIRFYATNESGKIKRAIYVPKMKGTIPLDKMVPFTVTDEGILVDTRERHG
jgi:KaiC/GvpD/RAD55 family RecA-like ATPase